MDHPQSDAVDHRHLVARASGQIVCLQTFDEALASLDAAALMQTLMMLAMYQSRPSNE